MRFIQLFAGAISLALLTKPVTANAAMRFQFRDPHPRAYILEETSPAPGTPLNQTPWFKARLEHPDQPVLVGNRLALHVKAGTEWTKLAAGRSLTLSRAVNAHVVILEAPDVLTALREAERLAQQPEVEVCYPVVRRKVKPAAFYAGKPNDPYFSDQWHLENRDASAQPMGVDLNVRAAWPLSRGDGLTIAVVDDGVELTHPELSGAAAGSPHFNFYLGTADGSPSDTAAVHSTAVAGLALARGGNNRGVSGVAPRAKLASWVVFDGSFFAADSAQMMDMFQYRSNVVSVQNHSWATESTALDRPSALEDVGISNAIAFGRSGRGVVMVRAAGNDEQNGGDANANGYTADARVITVGAVRSDGRVTKYSDRGACVLVAAPSAEINDTNTALDLSFPTLFTTDRQGSLGYNTSAYTNDLADYAFDSSGFSGTSGSCPQIAGIAALILAANTNLTYRDVQHVLIQASRHFDFADGDLKTNGAGFLVSHGAGFGVPDAGFAVRLARQWINRPALTNVTLTAMSSSAIPNDGLRVMVSGIGVPASLVSIPASPDFGAQPDDLTSSFPVVDVGQATGPIGLDLTGKVALIQRGVNFFRDKVQFASDAGATAAIIFNHQDGTARLLMALTQSSPIPAVFISQNDGETLQSYLQSNPAAQVTFQLQSANYSFAVTNALLCEHVAVGVQTDHSRRGDLRITLRSPQGTRSVLQRTTYDNTPGPEDWTYFSTHHFYEAGAGTWTVSVTDESASNTGNVQGISLSITGTPLNADAEGDGLADGWEMAHFATLAFGPKADPDGDGYSNAREQILGTNPLAADPPFQLDLSRFDQRLARLSWPGSTNFHYEILAGNEANAPLVLLTNVPGRFPEIEFFVSRTNALHRFFRVRTASPP